MRIEASPFDLVLAGLFGASALVLPMFFHAFGLGKAFLPMYVPLLVLALVARTPVAVGTAVLVPAVSTLATGMPPVYPPVLPKMCVELGLMALAASLARTHWRWGLFPAALLAVGVERAAYVVMTLFLTGLFHLPGREITLAMVVVSWPGILLQLAVAPPAARWLEPRVARMRAIR